MLSFLSCHSVVYQTTSCQALQILSFLIVCFKNLRSFKFVLSLKSAVILFLAKFSYLVQFHCNSFGPFVDEFTWLQSVTFVTVPWLYAQDKWILWQFPEIWITFCTCVQIIESLLIPEGTVYCKVWSGPYGLEWRVGPIN